MKFVSAATFALAMLTAPTLAGVSAVTVDDPSVPNCTLTLHEGCESVLLVNNWAHGGSPAAHVCAPGEVIVNEKCVCVK